MLWWANVAGVAVLLSIYWFGAPHDPARIICHAALNWTGAAIMHMAGQS